MSPLSNATTLANYASGIGTQGATLEVDSNNKRVGIGTTNPQGPEGSLQVGTAVTISGNSGIVSATTFHGDFGSSTSVAGNLNVSGVITYEDVTNIDSIGIMTARSGLNVTSGVVRVGSTDVYNSSDKLTLVNNSGNCSLTIDSTPTAESSVFFADGTSGQDAYRGYLQYNHSNDALLIATSATERIRITSDGKIGINQNTPQTTFHSTGTTNGQQATFGIDNSGLKISTFQKTDNDAGVILDAQKSSNGTLTFATTGTERLRITSDGAVTIGTNAPPASAKLTVRAANAEISAYSSAGGSSKLSLGDTNDHDDGSIRYVNGSGYQYMLFSTAATERMRITSSGQMGLGTNNPVQQSGTGLHIHNASGQTRIKLTNNITGSTANDGFDIIQEHNNDVHILNHEGGVLKFGTNDAEKMRITSSGNMGLGTNNPAERLHVNATGTTAGDGAIVARFYDAAQSKGLFLGYDSNEVGGTIYGANLLTFQTYNGSSWGERMRIDGSGRMGIGEVPSTNSGLFNVKIDNSSFHLGYGTNYDNYYSTGASGTHIFRNGGTEQMRITSSGNIGIGNNDPGTLLHVSSSNNGAVRIGGNNAGATGLTITYDNSSFTTTTILQNYRATNGNALLDIDTGMFTVSTGTSGLERFRIDASGRLLVGRTTAVDSHTVQVQASSGAEAVRIIGRSADDQSEITFVENDNSTILAQIQQIADRTVIRHRVGYIRFDTGGVNEKMRLDSSGRLLIGTTAGAAGRIVHANNSGNNSAYFHSTNGSTGTGSQDGIVMGMGDATNAYFWNYESGSIVFATNATERLRIRENGNVILGPYRAPAAYGTVSQNVPYEIKVAPYGWQNGSEIASISMGSHHGTGQDDGQIVFKTAADVHSTTNGLQERVRILSAGGLTFNGDVAQANALDDYEEGTFSPVFNGTSSISPAPTGHYTKIGRKVTVWINMTNATVVGSHNGSIGGLPYTCGGHRAGGFGMNVYNAFNTTDPVHAVIEINGTTTYLNKTVANNQWVTVGITAGSNRYLHLTMTYEV